MYMKNKDLNYYDQRYSGGIGEWAWPLRPPLGRAFLLPSRIPRDL
jgi:hypothetical protein